MAKLTRANQKIFAGSAPAGQIRQFGSEAEGTPVTTTNPETIQALTTRYDIGLQSALALSGEGNLVPLIEDYNALFYLLSYQIFYMFENGVPEYDDSTTYYVNSIVREGDTLYSSKTNDNLNNLPSTDGGTNWIQTLTFDTVNNRIGVGKSVPNVRFHLKQTSDNNTGGFRFENTAGSHTLDIYLDNNGILQLGNQVASFDGVNKRQGLGITIPLTKFHLKQAADNNSGAFRIENTSGSNLIDFFLNSSGVLQFDNSTLVIDTVNNRIGSGTITPDVAWEVLNTSTQFRQTHTDAVDFCDYTVDSDGNLDIAPSGGEMNIDGLLTVEDQPMCIVEASGNQSIPHNTTTVVLFNTETYDNTDMHSTVTNTGRITIAKAGRYMLTFNGYWNGVATPVGARRVYIRRYNSSDVSQHIIAQHYYEPQANENKSVMLSGMTVAAAGDYIVIEAFQNQGNAVSFTAVEGFSATLLS